MFILNKVKVFLLTLFFLINLVNSATNPLEVNVLEIIPNPVEPGEDFTVSINLLNPNTEEININSIELNLDEKFVFKSVNDNYNQVVLCQKCSKTLNFYLNSKSNLDSGIYQFYLNVIYNDQFSIKKEVIINVLGKPKLILTPIILNNISSNQEFDINFQIQNVGSTDAKNIKIISTSKDIGFLNQNYLFIKDLKHNQNISVIRTMLSSNDLNSGYSLIPLEIDYEDSKNNNYVTTENIGIKILDKSNLVIKNINFPNKIIKDKPFELSLRIENNGFGDAKDVNIILTSEIFGEKIAYFGTIEKNKDSPYTFNLNPNNLNSDIFTLTINYQDDFGLHTKRYDLKLNLAENKSFLNLFYSNSKYFYILITILLLIIFILLIIIIKNKNNSYNY